MGQKVDPRGLRVGVINDWDSKWYANKKTYGEYLVEDHKIRTYVKKNYMLLEFLKLKSKEHLSL